MRTFSALHGIVLAVALGIAGPAIAFDVKNIKDDTPPAEAFKYGFDAYKSGDKVAAAEALGYAAGKGHSVAQWKLGRMYAEGDGIKRDDYKAFELFKEVADAHADDSPLEPGAPFVSSSFVALGAYYRDGIPNTDIKPDLSRARQIFTYAASYFGDAEAQWSLAKMYYDGQGGDRDPLQAARWAKLAADKGNVGAQALLGHMLFEGEGVERQPVLGLMFMSLARDRASPNQTWIFDLQRQAVAIATESERRTAMALAEDWLAKNGGDRPTN